MRWKRTSLLAGMTASLALAYACSDSDASSPAEASPDAASPFVDAAPAALDAAPDVVVSVDAGYDGDPAFLDDAFTCPSPLPSIAAGLQPGVAVDYVAVRDTAQYVIPDAAAGQYPDGGAWGIVSEHGTPCATATDAGGCATALGALTQLDAGWISSECGFSPLPPLTLGSLVYTRGDEVRELTTRADVVAFLAPLDTIEEALLLINLPTRYFACDGTNLRDGAFHTVGYRVNADGSFDFLVPIDCGFASKHDHIAPDGTITTVGSLDAPDGSTCWDGENSCTLPAQ